MKENDNRRYEHQPNNKRMTEEEEKEEKEENEENYKLQSTIRLWAADERLISLQSVGNAVKCSCLDIITARAGPRAHNGSYPILLWRFCCKMSIQLYKTGLSSLEWRGNKQRPSCVATSPGSQFTHLSSSVAQIIRQHECNFVASYVETKHGRALVACQTRVHPQKNQHQSCVDWAGI